MIKEFIKNETMIIADKIEKINEDELCASIQGFGLKLKVEKMIEDLKSILYPNIYEQDLSSEHVVSVMITDRLNRITIAMYNLIKDILDDIACNEEPSCQVENPFKGTSSEDVAAKLALEFISKLPDVRQTLSADILAAYKGDPAAKDVAEVILCYPSIEAVSIYRLAHILYEMKVPFIPRIMTEYAHKNTGIDIHPGATIGPGFFIDHGTGVVIGETCTIGANVKLYQGVTLGARSFDIDESGNIVKGIKRHPDIKDNVVIYSGATILGGDTIIGENSIIGGNVWLVESVPANSYITNKFTK